MEAELVGASEMGAQIGSYDWSATPLGPLEQWPVSLRMAARLVLESRFPMCLWWGRELINLYNDAYRPVLGKRHPDALGQPASEVWREIWDTIGPQADDVMTAGRASWNDNRALVVTRNGYREEMYLTYSFSPAFDDAGGVAGVFCVCLEQTPSVTQARAYAHERKRAEALADERDQLLVRLREQFERMPLAVVVTDPTLKIIDWNPASERVFGFTRAEAIGRLVDHLILPPVHDPDIEQLITRLVAGQIEHNINENVTKDGRSIVCEWHNAPLRDAEGRLIGSFAMATDITARVAAEREIVERQNSVAAELAGMTRLQEVSRHLVQAGDSSSLLDEILDAAIAITAADMGNIQLVTPGTESLRVVVSRGFDDNFLTESANIVHAKAACGTALQTCTRIVVEDVATSPIFVGSPWLPVVWRAGVRALQSTPLVARSGRVVGVLSTHYRSAQQPAERDLRVIDLLARQAADWLERLEVQQEREQLLRRESEARAQAERSAQIRDDFVATLSHELRAPLNPIVVWSDVIALAPTDVLAVQRGAEAIGRNARLLAQLVGDLLDLSRIVTGKMRLDIARVELTGVIETAVDSMRAAAEARGVELAVVLEPTRRIVRGDASRLQQIVWNLVSNAVKFTPTGGRVLVTLAEVDTQVEISVRDTGKGIAPTFLPHVFERFRQADASATREHGGLGIGLAIVQELAELHGGTVHVYSEGIGRGSTFVVRLPVASQRSESDEPRGERSAPIPLPGNDAHDELDGIHVLIVDDERDGREALEQILRSRSARVTSVGSVDEALLAVARQLFDVVLADIGMPRRDGYELIAELRHRDIATPAVAVTAFARDDDRARALSAGFQDHIAKPVDATELVAIVATLAARQPVERRRAPGREAFADANDSQTLDIGRSSDR